MRLGPTMSEDEVEVSGFTGWRFRVVRFAGDHPRLYYALHRVVKSHRFENLVWPSTDICIEGPPGSGNTFFVTAFSMANPEANVAHHHHVTAQFKRAKILDVPSLILLRDPVDCALSRASAWGTPDHADVVLDQWTRMFEAEAMIERAVLVSFETATRSPSRAIEAVNQRFGASFQTSTPEREQVFAEMDQQRRRRQQLDRHNPNRPDGRRHERPREWEEMVRELPAAKRALERYFLLETEAV